MRLTKLTKTILKLTSVAALFGIFAFASCTNALEDKTASLNSVSGYGSLKLVKENNAKALDMADLTSATVTVSGYGMDDIIKPEIGISGGTGSAQIDGIPVGKNRIVTVKSNLDGALLRALVNIDEGDENTVSVTWNTTALANVYFSLLKNQKIDISSYESTEKTAIQAMIPDVHPSLVNASKIASDYASAKTGTASDYTLSYGTVEVKTNGVKDYTIQITDIASEKVVVSSDSYDSSLKAYPGSWKVYVFDENGTKVDTKNINVVSGKTSKVNVSLESTGGVPTDSITLYVPKNNSNEYTHVWAWNPSQTTQNYTNAGEWPGDPMTESGDYLVYTINATSSMVILNKNGNGQTGNLSISSAGSYKWNGSGFDEYDPGNGENVLKVSVTNPEGGGTGDETGVKVYVSADSAPSIWLWQSDGLETTKLMGYTWDNQPQMEKATDLNDNSKWYVFTPTLDSYTAGGKFVFILNGNSGNINSGKSATFWYDAKGVVGDAKKFYDSDPTTKPEPKVPDVTIKPASGNVKTTGQISITYTDGNDTISSAKVTINGTEYSMPPVAGTFSKTLAELGITEDGKEINVSVTVTNGQGTTPKTATLTSKLVDSKDTFTWDNANVYFVLTDRFYNGDTKNDHSYYRKNNLSGDENVATFHGGDIAGLTKKLDYFDKLGVNAIWITAPYEQAHGWVGGKDGKFPHYAFHGYYTLDWTCMDQNMGTVEELRTFVNACHSKGIRVVMDVVMNHVGYNNTQDMITYHYGKTSHTNGWLEKVGGKWNANDTVVWDNNLWDSTWFGPWIRSFGYESGTEYGGNCGGLPDVKTELTNSVGMAPVLDTKWKQEKDSDSQTVSAGGNTTGNKIGDYKNPSVANADWNGYSGDYRTDKNIAPADYQVVWLSAWVRELGIDGFRCDTAKHVEPYRWGQLKVACEAALEAWRNDSSKSKKYNGKDTGAEDWDESFWMTGECFGWTSTSGQGDYYTTGKFDSMINFSFNGAAGSGTSSSYPSESTWSSYLSINNNGDSDGNGNRNNVLTYVSSHDTRLCRASNQNEVGTMLQLTPGGVQIYYGDETSRPLAYEGCGDTDMMTRGDFNWDAAAGDCATHWGKVGTFRKYNPAVGAGTGSATKRTYIGSAGESKVAIGISGPSVDVKDLFADGTTVYNWYDGKSANVSRGSVSFAGGTKSQPILVSDKNPADYGVTF